MLLSGSGAFGNAATRLEAFIVKGGIYAYGSYPEIDELFPQQAAELDQKKRAAIIDKMQQLLARTDGLCADMAAGIYQRRSGRASENQDSG